MRRRVGRNRAADRGASPLRFLAPGAGKNPLQQKRSKIKQVLDLFFLDFAFLLIFSIFLIFACFCHFLIFSIFPFFDNLFFYFFIWSFYGVTHRSAQGADGQQEDQILARCNKQQNFLQPNQKSFH